MIERSINETNNYLRLNVTAFVLRFVQLHPSTTSIFHKDCQFGTTAVIHVHVLSFQSCRSICRLGALIYMCEQYNYEGCYLGENARLPNVG